MVQGVNPKDRSIAAVFAVVIWLIFAMIGFFLGEDFGRSQNAKANTEQHLVDAAARIKEICFLDNNPDVQGCIEGAMRNARELLLADHDLAAQRNMAEWAKWLLIVTVASAFVTGVGIWLVWRTLLATQQMTTITREIGRLENQAYCSVSALSAKLFGNNISFEPTFRNHGDTPVLRLRWKVEFSAGGQTGSGSLSLDSPGFDI